MEDFKYGKPMIAVGETDTMWTENNFGAYVKDPTDCLRGTLDDKKVRCKIASKVRDPEEAADLYAYLHALAPYEADYARLAKSEKSGQIGPP